jgi:hypothetical protein
MSTAAATPTATNSSAPRSSPALSLIAPNPIANGTKAIQVSVPTPDATPARMLEGTASCSRRVTGMLTATTSSVSATCAPTTSPAWSLSTRTAVHATTQSASTRTVHGRVNQD